MNTIVIGCGFAGAVIARKLSEAGEHVRIIERRAHIGGNAHDALDEHGILIHTYGPHIFHTNDEEVFRFLSRFTKWRPYAHKVAASVHGRLIPVPFNLRSLRLVFGEEAEMLTKRLKAAYGEETSVSILEMMQNDDPQIRMVARYVYEHIFLHYTMKQWDQKPEEIDPAVTARVPVRISEDDRYFQDRWQGMPKEGYTALFERMLDHPLIELSLNMDARDLLRFDQAQGMIYADGRPVEGRVICTGAVDELADHLYGPLPYRSLRFEHLHAQQEYIQPYAVINYTVSEPFTRITEFKHLSGQKAPSTSYVREYPMARTSLDQEPYYPIVTDEHERLYARYVQWAERFPQLYLLGRLAQYRYYNMDAIVKEALRLADELTR